jgi:molybdate transport system substrate-binding protein
MRKWLKLLALAAAACSGALIANSAARAADISVIATAGPMPTLMGALVPMFEQASSNKVTIKFQGVPQTLSQLKEGAAVDLLIADAEQMESFAKAGALVPSGATKIMLSRVGVAVKAGAPKPDIGSSDALKAALKAAKTVAYSQGASGQHFSTVITRLGLTDELKAKTIIVQGKPVGAAVAAGEAEIGIQQVAELMPVPGIDLVGPLPADLQKIIVYEAGVTAKAKDANAASALVKFLSSEAAVSVMKQKGMNPG